MHQDITLGTLLVPMKSLTMMRILTIPLLFSLVISLNDNAYSKEELKLLKITQSQLPVARALIELKFDSLRKWELKDIKWNIVVSEIPTTITRIQSPDSSANTTTVVVIDVSVSSDSLIFDALRGEVKRFIRKMKSNDKSAIICFDSKVRVLQKCTSDTSLLLQTVDNIFFGDGGSALYESVFEALELLSKQGGRRSILLISRRQNDIAFAFQKQMDDLFRNDDITLHVIATENYKEIITLRRWSFLTSGTSRLIPGTKALSGAFDSIAVDMLMPVTLISFWMDECHADSLRNVRFTASYPGGILTADTVLLTYFSKRKLEASLLTPASIKLGQNFTAQVQLSRIPHPFIVRKFEVYLKYDKGFMTPVRFSGIGLLRDQQLTMTLRPDSLILISGEDIFFDQKNSENSTALFEVEFKTGPDYPAPGRTSIYIRASFANQGAISPELFCFDLFAIISKGFAYYQEIFLCDYRKTENWKLVLDTEAAQGKVTVDVFLGTEMERSVIHTAVFKFQFDSTAATFTGFDTTGVLFSTASYKRIYISWYLNQRATYYISMKGIDATTNPSVPLLRLNFTYQPRKTYSFLPISIELVSLLQQCCYTSPKETITFPLDGLCEKVAGKKKQVYPLNYPNPFNNSTTIRYVLSKPGEVRHRVINFFGQEVFHSVATMQTEGTQFFLFDGSQLQSGLYMYQLEVYDPETKSSERFSRAITLAK